MHRFSTQLAVLAGILALSLSTANAGKLVPVPQVPGSYVTWVQSINDGGEITGNADFQVSGLVYRDAYVGTLDGQYVTFHEADDTEFPTYVTDIDNDGYVTGNGYYDSDPVQCGHGFVRAPDGTIVDVTRNGVIFSGTAAGITKKQNFVGASCEVSFGRVKNYGYYGRGTKYRADLVLPFNTDQTMPGDISKKDGAVVGGFWDSDLNRYRAFLLKSGVATAFDYPDPNATYTFFDSINDKGMATGSWTDPNFTTYHSFLFDIGGNRLKALGPEGATVVIAGGINNAGLVALNVDYLPYIYCSRKSTCPAFPKAIDVDDKWVPVPATALHAVVCRNGCLKSH